MMLKVKALIGYLLAVTALFIVLATFIGSDSWAGSLLMQSCGLKVSPWFTGGEVLSSVERGNYQINLHKPVFQGLIHERKEGFVQLDWTPLEGLPGTIRDQLDYNLDGRCDFRIVLNTKTGKAFIHPESREVIGLGEVVKLSNAWMVRVNLRNRLK